MSDQKYPFVLQIGEDEYFGMGIDGYRKTTDFQRAKVFLPEQYHHAKGRVPNSIVVPVRLSKITSPGALVAPTKEPTTTLKKQKAMRKSATTAKKEIENGLKIKATKLPGKVRAGVPSRKMGIPASSSKTTVEGETPPKATP